MQSGDGIGSISFQGADGSEFVEGAQISAVIDGTAGADSMPTRLEFYTSSTATLSERMRIDSSGSVGIGTSPSDKFHVSGNTILQTGGNSSMYLRRLGTYNSFDSYNWPITTGYPLLFNASTYDFQINDSTKLSINSSGHVLPGTSNTQDLGATTARWRNIYTGDLHLANKFGDYTIVEGEDELFLYNNKKNKVYKFALIEVDANTAPPKAS